MKSPLNNSKNLPLASRPYSEEDHGTWSELFARQREIVSRAACKEFFNGLETLELDPKRLPDIRHMSERLSRLSGWTLSNAKDEYLSMQDWFPLLRKRSFPVTDYIRRPEEIEYTPLPDLFHEYFGHLAFFTDPKFGDIAQEFGAACKGASERQILEISRIWWYTIEFGLVRENGEEKVLGAGLLSSPRECLHALSGKSEIAPFDLGEVIRTPGSPHELHKKYFFVESIRSIRYFLSEYVKREGLSS